jgi:hypothetical protein
MWIVQGRRTTGTEMLSGALWSRGVQQCAQQLVGRGSCPYCRAACQSCMNIYPIKSTVACCQVCIGSLVRDEGWLEAPWSFLQWRACDSGCWWPSAT